MQILHQPWRAEYNKLKLQEALFPAENRTAAHVPSAKKIAYYHEVNQYLMRRMCEAAKNPSATPAHKQERAVFFHRLLDANMGRIFHERNPEHWADPRKEKEWRAAARAIEKKKALLEEKKALFAVQKQAEQQVSIPMEIMAARPIAEACLAYA